MISQTKSGIDRVKWREEIYADVDQVKLCSSSIEGRETDRDVFQTRLLEHLVRSRPERMRADRFAVAVDNDIVDVICHPQDKQTDKRSASLPGPWRRSDRRRQRTGRGSRQAGTTTDKGQYLTAVSHQLSGLLW